MNCKKCGALLEAGAKVCTNCGELVSNMGISSSQINGQFQTITNSEQSSIQTSKTNLENNNLNNQSIQSGVSTSVIGPNINGLNTAFVDSNEQLVEQETTDLQNKELQKVEENKKNKVKDKNKNKNVLVIVLVAIIALAIGGSIGYLVGTKMSKSTINNNSMNENNNIDNNSDSSKNDNTFLGYTYDLPGGFICENEDGILLISSDEMTFSIELFEDTFDDYYNNPSLLKTLFEEDYTINGSTRTINNSNLRLIAIPIKSSSTVMYAILSETSIDGVIALSFLKRSDNQLNIQNLDNLTYFLNSLEKTNNDFTLSTKVRVNSNIFNLILN